MMPTALPPLLIVVACGSWLPGIGSTTIDWADPIEAKPPKSTAEISLHHIRACLACMIDPLSRRPTGANGYVFASAYRRVQSVDAKCAERSGRGQFAIC